MCIDSVVDKLQLSTKLNDKVMQNSNTSDMIWGVADIVSFLSQGTTLKKGTVIFTGTPEGVGFVRKPYVYLKEGDTVRISVEGLGFIENKVVFEYSVCFRKVIEIIIFGKLNSSLFTSFQNSAISHREISTVEFLVHSVVHIFLWAHLGDNE